MLQVLIVDLDFDLPGLDGFEMLARLAHRKPRAESMSDNAGVLVGTTEVGQASG